MSLWTDCLKNSSIKAAYIKRNAAIIELNDAAEKFKKLDANNPNIRQYVNINKDFEAAELTLKTENRTFVHHILHASQDFSQNADFKKDQESVKSSQFEAVNLKDIYQLKLEELGHLPKLSDQLGSASTASTNIDLTTLLTS